MSVPDWVQPVAEYMLKEGLRGTLQIAALALFGSTVIGITLGTLLTIKFMPLRGLIRLYIKVCAGSRSSSHLHHLLPAPAVSGQLRSTRSRPPRSGSRSGGARRWPKRRAGPSSRSLASNTRHRPRSGSAGSGGTRS